MPFDSILIVDWSGGNDRGPRPKSDAIWACVAREGNADEPKYFRNRQLAEQWITSYLQSESHAGRRVLAGFDFSFGFPVGFGHALTGSDDPLALWDWLEQHVQDGPSANNRFDLAGQINSRFPGIGPFWGNGLRRDIPHLPRKGSERTCDIFPEKRAAEASAKGAFPIWQLSGAGAVGSQVIMGLPMLARLRRALDVSVWPFEKCTSSVVLAEIWPSLVASAIRDTMPEHAIKDAHQVRCIALALSVLPSADLQRLIDVDYTPEGTILGLNAPELLENAIKSSALTPPPLRNDCFAMPQGAHWTPVDIALDHLRDHLQPVTGTEQCALGECIGRLLAHDVTALRSHPPAPNSAVDGYALAGPAPDGPTNLPLVDGRSAAGQPYPGHVPAGHAIRILTGANMPAGTDTVILQEDVNASDSAIAFHGPLKRGANARTAGEDMKKGEVILTAGRKITPGDLGMLAAAGVGTVTVHKRLRVGILSTGDELCEPGETADVGQIFDANRPMLNATVAGWGYEVIDLGRAADKREPLTKILNSAAQQCDVIISSGGASAGDEDHMSALLQGTGSFALWRIAMKPGRPLALGMWENTPVIGLPGNPVAAMVCALIFARPALQRMAGGRWERTEGYLLPAAFEKSKKAGRREYLRARVQDGKVQIFPSEGSGRVSGLSWATGLVELSDEAQVITPGDQVYFLPFGNFAK
ncbi:molybdopterin-binding protein [Loktanella sp. S4079]|uniref:molybdopterin-binding protein n=1 Tax=Loktanella sp. S4079 TaxID=579483 RepID=UPI0005FA1B8D|nr:gephyrin-like molybdotransferase Glp [Loktanella sp. S4079]KJZ18046.1 molybdopterin biosynthesis protein MoeA [Loktanella sp. S4079]